MKINITVPAKLVVLFTLILSFMLFLLPVVIALPIVNAADTSTASSSYTLLEPLPGITKDSATYSMVGTTSISTYFEYAFNLLIALAAVAAVFMIVWGGLQYMSTDSWSGKNDGKEKIWNAILGLIMILCAWLILNTVNPNLLKVVKIDPLTTSSSVIDSSAASSGSNTSDTSGNSIIPSGSSGTGSASGVGTGSSGNGNGGGLLGGW